MSAAQSARRNNAADDNVGTPITRILVAGIGNIFLGDDAFGVEVAQQLIRQELPAGVDVRDFGIRSYDLAYALMNGYDVAILIDATQQGGAPGTLYLIEPDLTALAQEERQLSDAHTMNPMTALRLVHAMGGKPGRIYVIGCEPATLAGEEGALGLSPPVQAAVAEAIAMVQELIAQLLAGKAP